jgi:hypothetical protein
LLRKALHTSLSLGLALTVSVMTSVTSPLRAAETDYSADLSARTYSAGLSVEPRLGLTEVLWGDSTTPFFGYIRPAVSAAASPTYYAGKVSLSLFPVSFLGVTFAKNWSHRYRETGGYDCHANTCMGSMDSSEVAFRFMTAYQSYFLSSQLQRVFYAANSEGDQNLMDPINALIYKEGGSTLANWGIILGKKVAQGVESGLIIQRGDLDGRISASEADYVFVRSKLESYGFPNLSATIGLGRFNTDIKRPGVSAIALLTYTGKAMVGPSL